MAPGWHTTPTMTEREPTSRRELESTGPGGTVFRVSLPTVPHA